MDTKLVGGIAVGALLLGGSVGVALTPKTDNELLQEIIAERREEKAVESIAELNSRVDIARYQVGLEYQDRIDAAKTYEERAMLIEEMTDAANAAEAALR